jgi:hypothetical protein
VTRDCFCFSFDSEKPAIPSFIEIEMHNQNQKGAIMNTRMQTDSCIYRTLPVLGLIAVVSAIGMVILTIMVQPMSELLVALGLIATSGLMKLLISLLNRGLFG